MNTNNSDNIDPQPPKSTCRKQCLLDDSTDEIVIEDVEYLDMWIQEVDEKPYRTNIRERSAHNIRN